ncbi:MAG TPA: serine/threonine-protein kinase, partial [Candidatus Nanopelagicales bacterium]|nr:serine/threonine-protein kinase [Candidatus Nanopelagicales bacterium]
MKQGEVVAGRYEIQLLAGAGGMGAVYRALDRETGHAVALKLVQPSLAPDRARFSREAEVLASLSHPGIVAYLGHGRTGDGALWLAMEWLDGEDLAARLRRAPLSIDDALTIGRATAEALAFAHARGVIHRDIKPANLFLTASRPDQIKILDFGVARAEAGAVALTRAATAVGTPGYMAPEQARGDDDVDPRADLFSLGCVLFECLTGRPAFVGDHPLALLAKILLEEVPRVRELAPEVPPALSAFVERMMARDRAARPDDAASVVRELDALATATADSTSTPLA